MTTSKLDWMWGRNFILKQSKHCGTLSTSQMSPYLLPSPHILSMAHKALVKSTALYREYGAICEETFEFHSQVFLLQVYVSTAPIHIIMQSEPQIHADSSYRIKPFLPSVKRHFNAHSHTHSCHSKYWSVISHKREEEKRRRKKRRGN